MGTDTIRWSFESPQAMRILFGKGKEQNDGSLSWDRRHTRATYGLGSIYKTTGPEKLKVFPFTDKIELMIENLSNAIRPFLKGSVYENVPFLFTCLEMKLYLGDDIVTKIGSNKTVGMHTDIRCRDDGTQEESDSADGNHVTIVFTIGATRQLELVTFCKKKGGIWEQLEETRQIVEMKHNSMFVLFPKDKKPKEIDGCLRKTKHSVKFSNSGVSVAIVVRAVKTFAEFDSNNELIDKYVPAYHQTKRHMFEIWKDERDRDQDLKAIRSIKNRIKDFLSESQKK